jgi:hypothetical protein
MALAGPLSAQPGPSPRLDWEKIADRLVRQMALQPGVLRLSLGNNEELGGKVRGNYVRWNFFTDATVTVDGKAWVKDGKLTPP